MDLKHALILLLLLPYNTTPLFMYRAAVWNNRIFLPDGFKTLLLRQRQHHSPSVLLIPRLTEILRKHWLFQASFKSWITGWNPVAFSAWWCELVAAYSKDVHKGRRVDNWPNLNQPSPRPKLNVVLSGENVVLSGENSVSTFQGYFQASLCFWQDGLA